MKNIKHLFLVCVIVLVGCTKQAQAVPVTPTLLPRTATLAPPTETPTEAPTATSIASMPPDPTADLTIFGAIGQNEIQAFALESVANAIFSKTFDGFVADGRIQEYQVMRVSVFPGSGGLLSEIIFNVRTTDPSWLDDGGTQGADHWVNEKCYRFDFFTTDTEFQLKNRRACG
ncbi:MAG: hypothetical protein QM730_02810 [Anaerolineales bacterium]